MIIEREINSLRANQRFVIHELLSRGIEISILNWDNELLEAKLGKHYEILFDIDSSIVPYTASVVAGSKSITKELLQRAGLSTPHGKKFKSEDVLGVISGAEEIGFPVVLKPSQGFQGKDVHTCLENEGEVRGALSAIVHQRGSCEILVEEYFSAREFRVFITKEMHYAALHRDPAYVIGDGVRTIKHLALIETYRRMNPRKNCLCPIVLDEESRRFLAKREKSFITIPHRGEKVYLRGSSNVMMGGVAEDITEDIHPSLVTICLQALSTIPQLPYAGIDVLCLDPTKLQTSDSYKILELNSVPGIGIHMAPGKGKPRNVAAMIVDLIFPESKGIQNALRNVA